MDKHTLRIYLILLFGLLTPVLMTFIPVSIGGNSFIFIITIPLSIFIAIIFSIKYYSLKKRTIKEINKRIRKKDKLKRGLNLDPFFYSV